ncbi:MAG TPA: phosphotransferase family protein, partial [Acidimicrobiia bacterium]|nr:phosphotransferase family protein [Acidimicrobiia bacterium]
MADVDPAITAWVEQAVGGEVVSLQQIPAGGRTGFAVDVGMPDGTTRELFLQRGGRGGVGSFMGFDREAEVYRALEPLGIPIPHVWGVDEAQDVFLVDRARGHAWFQAPRDPEVALAVAQDFMRQLATWHRAGARALDLPSFGPVKSVREHQAEQLAGIKESFEAQDAKEPIDLLARVQLEHLLSGIPTFDGEPVLVQGDTGPGNFMYEDGKVTAIVDWELAHLGDPMDDIAWLSLRAVQEPFTHFP